MMLQFPMLTSNRSTPFPANLGTPVSSRTTCVVPARIRELPPCAVKKDVRETSQQSSVVHKKIRAAKPIDIRIDTKGTHTRMSQVYSCEVRSTSGKIERNSARPWRGDPNCVTVVPDLNTCIMTFAPSCVINKSSVDEMIATYSTITDE